MAFCINCGQELAEGAKFCANCGKAVSNNSTTQRKTVYDGELHKCPNCGELLNSFVTNCPSCGYELRSVKTNSPVEALAKKIEKAASLDEKIELIANFYIPNTKEDIYDFFILAVSNLEDNWYDTDDAWRAKLEQAYHKAKLTFGNTPEFAYLEQLYTKTRKKITKRERSISAIFRKNKVAFIATILALVGLVMLAIGIIMRTRGVEEGEGLKLLSLLFFMFIPLVSTFVKEDEKKANRMKKGTSQKYNSTLLRIGKHPEEFLLRNYADMTEYLRSVGFKNIETKAEQKGLLKIEGAIKGISIAGNPEFRANDKFDVNSKIIIRYYSSDYKGN